MTVTVALLRKDFTEFANTTTYPEADVAFWLNVASQLLNQDRWGAPAAVDQPNSLYDLGQELFAAHNLAIEARAKAEAVNGAPPGTTTGPVSSKSVDKVSIAYAVDGAIEPNAGHWNLTIYGTRYARMVQMVGAGGIQLGVGYDPTGLGGDAYSGPWPYQYPNPSG